MNAVEIAPKASFTESHVTRILKNHLSSFGKEYTRNSVQALEAFLAIESMLYVWYDMASMLISRESILNILDDCKKLFPLSKAAIILLLEEHGRVEVKVKPQSQVENTAQAEAV